MTPLTDALRGATHAPPTRDDRLPRALVAGAGGTLGSALLAQALVDGRYGLVAAVVRADLGSSLRGLRPVRHESLVPQAAALQLDTAFVVYERERHSNGRDEAFHQPHPGELLALSTLLHAAGLRRLLVVVPHAPALLPLALQGGFASQDEAAVAGLGFEQLVFVRAAQSLRGAGMGSWLARLGRSWLGQLHWMVPQRQQPVRTEKLAQLMVALARELPDAPHGARVVPTELLWAASQATDPRPVLRDWLCGVAPPMPSC